MVWQLSEQVLEAGGWLPRRPGLLCLHGPASGREIRPMRTAREAIVRVVWQLSEQVLEAGGWLPRRPGLVCLHGPALRERLRRVTTFFADIIKQRLPLQGCAL